MLETRRARRFDCDETVDCESQGQVRVVYLKDVSALGARLQGLDLPEVGKLIRLTPTFSELGRQWIYAQICWIRREGGEVSEAGVRFLEPSQRIRTSWVGRLCDSDPERRTSIRVNTEVFLEVKVPGQRRALEATSVDLSQGGAQAILPGVVRPGTQMEVTLCLPWAIVDVPAQVIRQASLESAHHCLRFLELEHHQADALNGYLKQELLQQRQAAPTDLHLLRLFNRG